MAETYSLAVTGALADSKNFRPQSFTLPDSGGATHSLQRQSIRANAQLLCQGPDLGNDIFTIDAERSNPSKGLIFLLRV